MSILTDLPNREGHDQARDQKKSWQLVFGAGQSAMVTQTQADDDMLLAPV